MTATAEERADLVLLHTKLRPPARSEGIIPRPRLTAVLDAAASRRLSLVSAPAGSGKTALVSAWAQDDRPGRQVAWVSLDENDNDPFRFWTYVFEALRQLEPGLARSLRRHKAAANEHTLTEFVLPRLLNVLDELDYALVLVLDDLHVVSDPVCHRTLQYVFDHLPGHVHLCLVTRIDPPLPLPRLRVNGDMVEIRSSDLAFTTDECVELLDGVMALGLAQPQVQRLCRLTEGWPAALYVAGLSIRGGSDTDAFITSFERGNRYVFDYLASEVLRQLRPATRDFLLQTSVLRKLCAPLCDALCSRTDSAEMIAELDSANLFLVPLDAQREWYRYHQLFAGLLRLDLDAQGPASVVALHRRAAQWYEESGDVQEAIHHSIQGDDLDRATRLIIAHWLSFERSGHAATVERWLAALPEAAVRASPSLAVIAAWVGSKLGASRAQVEQWLDAAEAVRDAVPAIPGSFPVAFAIPLARAVFCFGDVGLSLAAARAALTALGDSPDAVWEAVGVVTLGRCLYFAGLTEEAHRLLTDLSRRLPSPEAQPNSVINAWALLSLLDDDAGDHGLAAEEAARAFDHADSYGLRFDPLTDLAHLARARAARRAGRLAEAEATLDELIVVAQHPGSQVSRGHVFVELAMVQNSRGEIDNALATLQRARDVERSCVDAGPLGAHIAAASTALQRSPAHGPANGSALTKVETRILHLLDTSLTQVEIARELQVSVNTVRTHIQAVYRKLGVGSRADALSAARALRGHHPRAAEAGEASKGA